MMTIIKKNYPQISHESNQMCYSPNSVNTTNMSPTYFLNIFFIIFFKLRRTRGILHSDEIWQEPTSFFFSRKVFYTIIIQVFISTSIPRDLTKPKI